MQKTFLANITPDKSVNIEFEDIVDKNITEARILYPMTNGIMKQ